MDQLLYRPKEAAQVLGRSKTALYGLIRANRIRSIKDGKFRFITADALHEYVRTIEHDYEEAELNASKANHPEAAPDQRRRLGVPAQRRLLGRGVLRPDHLRKA